MTEYLGYKEVVPTDEELGVIYGKTPENIYNCHQNEYLILRDAEENVIETFRCSDNQYTKVGYKTVNSRFLGRVKPRNIHQRLAMDMLYRPDITVKIITGKFGTGKDFLMCSAAVDMIEGGKFDRIVYVRNNIEVKNSKPIGFLPGSYNEKLLPFAMPLADHLGGVDGLNLMVSSGKIDIVHLGFIRGRDIKNSIIICSEAENMTKEHVQLLLGRVGEGSELWLNGDFRQCDAEVFRSNSGLMTAVERLKGHPRFGYVNLQITERSETAAMADLLD